MSSCYNFNKVDFKTIKNLSSSSSTDNYLSVDATYVINLEGNGRLPAVYEQFKIYKPSETIIILLNKGYKKCEKTGITNTSDDLTDAYLTIFKHANENGYNNVLIFEDDFIFDKNIEKEIPNINKFLNNHHGDYMYLLGCLPFLMVPYFSFETYLLLGSGGTHSAIYTKELRKRVLNTPRSKITDWDFYTNLHTRRYTYKKMLCYQLFTETENYAQWSKTSFLAIFPKFYIKLLNVNKNVYPGYAIATFIAKVLPLLIIYSIFLIIKNNVK